METKKRAKKLIKKMGHKFGPGHGDFNEIIEKIPIEYLKNHILENVSKYRKLFIRYSSDSRIRDVQKEPPVKKKKHSKKKAIADKAVQIGLAERDVETEKQKTSREEVETGYCYNLYKSGKKNGLDSTPRKFYGHLLPILLHKDEDIWRQFVKVQGEAKSQKFHQLAQYTVGDQTLLESLMRIFLQLICDDPISTAELSHFMNLFAIKKMFLSEELSGCRYGDLMAAIVAVYIDQVAIESRNVIKVNKIGKKLAKLVFLLLAESPMVISDCLLQCEKLTEKDAVLVTPLFRRAFQILKSQAKLTPPMYARALCLNQETKRIFKMEANGNTFQADFRSLPIPETFQTWLNKNGIKEYYIDTNQPAAFIASLMEALVGKELSKAQDNDSSEEEVDVVSKVKTNEADQLFFIDTGADTARKDIFPDMPQVVVEGVEGESDQGDDDDDEWIASTSDEDGDEVKESHCSTIVAETLKAIRELTEKKRTAANYKEMRATSADFFEDSDVEVLEVRSFTKTCKGQDSEKKRRNPFNSDIEKVEEPTADKERSLNSCIELDVVEKSTSNKGQSGSERDFGIEVPAEDLPKKGEHLLEKEEKGEKLIKSGSELKKTRSSKRGKGILNARKSDDEHGSVIMMNLVDMFAPEVTGEEDISSVLTQDLNIVSDVAVPDGRLLPIDTDLDELNPAVSSRKSPSKAAKSNFRNGSSKHSQDKDDVAQPATSPSKSHKKLKAAAEIDDCQIVSSPKKRRLEGQPKFDSPKKGVVVKAPTPEKTKHSEKLQKKRVKELLSTPRMRTRSDDCHGVAASPVSPHTPRRRTRSEMVHTSPSSTKSPLKEVDLGSDCKVSRNKLKFHLPTCMDSGIIIEEVDEQFQPLDDDASKRGTQSKKTRNKATRGNKVPGSPYEFHGSSSEVEGHDTVIWSTMSLCGTPKSMTKIKSKNIVHESEDEISKTPKVTPAKTSSKATGSPKKHKKSRTPAGTSVQSKTAFIAETKAIENDGSVYSETPTGVPDSRAKTPAESKSSKKKKARQSIDSSKVAKETNSGENDKSDIPSASSPKGKSVLPVTPKSVRGAGKELTETVPSTPKGKSVPPGTPKSVRGAGKELAESVPCTPKGKSIPPDSPKSVRRAGKKLAETVPSTPKGKSVPSGTPKSVRGAGKELAESVPCTPKGKSIPPGTPKSVRRAGKELAETVPSTPKGKSVPPGTPKSVRGAGKELTETVPCTPKGKSVPPDTPKSVRRAGKELAVLKQCAMTDFFTASPLSPEETRRRYSLRHKPEEDDAHSSIFNKSANPVSDADIFGTPQAAVTYSGKKRRVSEIPRASSDFNQLASPAAKRRLSSIKKNPGIPSKLGYDLRH
ncbi:nucleolar protein dao-5-like [Lineus longissimus]|uniref:nucleolar protein dao-5-like n=1 Tax=Lineus longissimus TaxID=88925 RepID=UPI00315C4DA8